MAKNSKIRPFTQAEAPDYLLSLLSAVCGKYGQTFSWYTSTKGRMWLTLKGRDPIVYTTSVECDLAASVEATLDALVVLFATHIPKVQQVAPPLVSWITSKAIPAQVEEAWAFCNGLDLDTLGPLDEEVMPPVE